MVVLTKFHTAFSSSMDVEASEVVLHIEQEVVKKESFEFSQKDLAAIHTTVAYMNGLPDSRRNGSSEEEVRALFSKAIKSVQK